MAKFIVKWFLPGDHRRTCIRVRIRFSSIKIEFGTEEPIYEAETQMEENDFRTSMHVARTLQRPISTYLTTVTVRFILWVVCLCVCNDGDLWINA